MHKLNHVGLVVSDLEASEAWYAKHLGFKRLYEYTFPGVRAVFIRLGEFRLELLRTDGANSMLHDRERPETNLKIGGINHFAIEVDDVDTVVEKLKRDGVEIVIPPTDVPEGHGDRFAFIHDNEKALVELFQPGRV